MLKYIELRWSNCFSYGENNSLRFDGSSITQLVGKNGHGKSSIALILEEVQFNKNSKGVKKAAILNRHSGAKSYSIELDFEKDGVPYTIITSRGSAQKVSLLKDGEDISSHTATSTFKDIENLLGFDHNTFSQIVYQSSTASLEFLTTTDTQRKKFLIDLLNLERYAKALEIFKDSANVVSKEIAVVEAKMQSSTSWIAKYSNERLEPEALLTVPGQPTDLENELRDVIARKADLANEAARISQNNKYKELRDSVILLPAPTEQVTQADIDTVRANIAVASNVIRLLQLEIKGLKGTKTKCPTCGSALGVDLSHIHDSVKTKEAQVEIESKVVDDNTFKLSSLLKLQKEWASYSDSLTEYEKYHALYDPSLPSTAPDVKDLEGQVISLQADIKKVKRTIELATAENTRIAAHNAKVELIKTQLADMRTELATHTAHSVKLNKRLANLQVLVKAFSTTGLVAYKIEGLVKDLEAITNEYLGDMADGRFQLGFQISTGDKLNVVITDNGNDVDINALSSGERARVNISTLLAIRKLMQNLSSTKTNLLILDETVENLDSEGKEKLIEVLVAEEDLNTILISHSFTHPLIDRIGIIKEDNISRIEK